MKKVATISVTGQKKGNYKRIWDGYDWDLGRIIFEKEETRGLRKSKKPKTF